MPKTTGMLIVAAFAATAAAALPGAAMTATWRRTNSAANSGNRVLSFSADRNSSATFRPSSIAHFAQSLTEGRNGICDGRKRPRIQNADHRHLRLLRGRRAAAPLSSVMNSRRCSGRDVRFIARPPHRTVRAAFPHTAPTSGV